MNEKILKQVWMGLGTNEQINFITRGEQHPQKDV